MKRRFRSWALPALAGLWLIGAGATLALAGRYRATPGAAAAAPDTWPGESSIVRDVRRPTVVMLAHPRCPCTRASLSELARLMREVGDRAAVHVLFVRPAGESKDWESTDTWRRAHEIPGVVVDVDVGGVEAKRFGAETSGQVMAFNPTGKRIFSGGITAGRDHAGDNAGHDRLREVLLTGAVETTQGPVYGCPLHDAAPPTGARP